MSTNDILMELEAWKARALAAEATLEKLIRPVRTSSEPAVYGGWFLCPECRRPVTNGEQCKNCQKEIYNQGKE